MDFFKSKTILERMLAEKGFSEKNINLDIAWQVVKEFSKIAFKCDSDDFLWQTGIYSFTGKNAFHYDITRQFFVEPADDDYESEGFYQLNFTIHFEALETFKELSYEEWSEGDFSEFFSKIENHKSFKIPRNYKPLSYEINFGDAG